MTTPLFTRLAVFKQGYMSMMMKWNINLLSSVPWSQHHCGFVGLFREQSPCLISFSMHTIWTPGSPPRGMGVNSDELCSRPLFVNPTSNASCHSGQRWPNPLLIKNFHFFRGVSIILPYICICKQYVVIFTSINMCFDLWPNFCYNKYFCPHSVLPAILAQKWCTFHLEWVKAGIPNGVYVDPLGVYGSLKGVYESPRVYWGSICIPGVYWGSMIFFMF